MAFAGAAEKAELASEVFPIDIRDPKYAPVLAQAIAGSTEVKARAPLITQGLSPRG